MITETLKILEKYLQLFPKEHERQKILLEYLNQSEDKNIINSNNFEGHIV